MRKGIFLFFLLVFGLAARGQTLRGIVLDSASRRPVEGMSVFLNGTSTYALTDKAGKYTLSIANPIQASLVFSHISYLPREFAFPYAGLPDTLWVQEKINAIEPVAVTTDKTDRKEKLVAFRHFFLGNTRAGTACKILNEDEIELIYSASQRCLYAYCDKPIRIRNTYTGYEVQYNLETFLLYFQDPKKASAILLSNEGFLQVPTKVRMNDLAPELGTWYKIVGTSFFIDLDPDNKTYRKHRGAVYQRSDTHFFHDLTRGLITKEGGQSDFRVIDPYRDPIDVEGIVTVVDSLGMKRLTIRPHFDSEDIPRHPERETYSTLRISYRKIASSLITFNSPYLWVDLYGNPDPAAGLFYFGDLSSRRIGDLLPGDYMPD